MNLYKFETDEFGLSGSGIHLLRSRFNYETIDLAVIDNIIIEKGRQVNNWIGLLVFGLVLFAFGSYMGIRIIYEYFFAYNFTRFYIEQFVLPVLPLCIGIFSIYISIKRGPVILITAKNKRKRFSIGQLKRKSQIDDLITFLKENELTKNKLNVRL